MRRERLRKPDLQQPLLMAPFYFGLASGVRGLGVYAGVV
jgi:hypothetical protein